MFKKISPDEAKRILGDVAPERCFWVNNGPVLKNLNELMESLKEMNKENFKHHVNKDKNDFSTWVAEVIGDAKLADDLMKVKTKNATIKKIKSRLDYLKKATS